MKLIEIPLSAAISEQFFYPIRTKVQQAQFVLRAMKFFMNLDKLPIPKEPAGKVILSLSKMNRLTVVRPNKIFSVAFPFTFQTGGGKVTFKSKAVGQVDSIAISLASGVLNDEEVLANDCIAGLADKVLDSSNTVPNLWGFLQELLLYEDGYIRFDRDAANTKGHLHPLDHLDVFYSSNATFKIGLKNIIEDKTLIDILDITTDCHYLEKAT